MKRVAEIRGLRITAGGEPHSGWLPPGAATPLPTPVRELVLNLYIEEEGGSFFLICEGESRCDYSDSWHQSLEEAMAVANEGFGVAPSAWNWKP